MFTWLLFQIHTINFLYAVAGLLVFGVTLGLVWDYVNNSSQWYKTYVKRYVWPLLLLTLLGGVLTTLLYSEVFGFVPCSLCWLQRVALYPQLLIGVIAWRKKDSVFFPLYGTALSVFGVLVAIYQYIYQALPKELLKSGILPCLADGSADCSKTVMEVFGFVTFPFLSAVLFLFLITLYLHMSYNSNHNHNQTEVRSE